MRQKRLTTISSDVNGTLLVELRERFDCGLGLMSE